MSNEQATGSDVQSRWSRPRRQLVFGVGVLAVGLGHSLPALADAELARAKNCMACHAMEKKLIGPSYKDVAIKYASDQGAGAKLAGKVRNGGVGVWGQIPMPANPQVSAEEASKLVTWILRQK